MGFNQGQKEDFKVIGEIFVKIYKFTLKFFTHSYIKEKKRSEQEEQSRFNKRYKLFNYEYGNSSHGEEIKNKTYYIAENIEYSEFSSGKGGGKGNNDNDIYNEKENIFKHNEESVMRENNSEYSEKVIDDTEKDTCNT